uniref:Acetyltransferase component of pyruvate dehydrogenase complex n=1 Tax=Globisporangium ultimum (strain ATCC 200006 / CBS 805.95 / DAOM BR144) TaxID=431595 RepID=K3W988_GLOUD
MRVLRQTRNVWQRVAVFDVRSGGLDAQLRRNGFTAVRTFASLPDHEVVGLPALSPTMEAGNIAKWHKNEGELVAAGDIICEVETDKAVVDYEATDDFYLAKILKQAGSGEIKVGEPIFVTVAEADDVPAFKDFAAGAAALPASEPAPAATPSTPAAPSAAPVAKPLTPAAVADAAPARASSDRVFASPLAKKIARESGAVLSVINGTGPHGRVVKADVEEALARGQATQTAAPATEFAATSAAAPAPAAASPVATHDYVDYPISPEAQALAQQLTQQKLDVPHYHLTADLTLDKLLAARARLNAGRAEDEQLSVNDFIVRAASLAMRKIPEVNSTWKGSFIRQYNDTNINLIVSTANGGSVAPVISNVNRIGLSDINKSVRELVAKANDGSLSSSELANGTFTISNVGMYDVKSLAGIVRPDQACLLGLGTIEKKVVPNDDPEATQIYKYAQVMSATLACDHRVIDGAVGAQWLAVFKELVEDPLKMIL